jgi:hypothetical protein
MAHFQLASERRPYGTRLGGTRLFLSGASGQEAIFIELGKSVTLEVSGIGNVSPAITQFVVPPSAVDVVSRLTSLLLTGKPAGPDIVSVTTFGRRVTLKGIQSGTCILMVGGGNGIIVQTGQFRNHTDMKHDLIANTFRSADPEKMHALNRMLFNDPDNLFNENSGGNINRWGDLACGTVSKVGGAAIFYGQLNYDYREYYRTPIAGKTRKDIKIDSAKLDRGRNAIQTRLAKGMPSIVGLVYADTAIQKGAVNVTGTGGHTVLIVGCSNDRKKFLYIDVWQGGSKLKYTGGYAGRTLFPDPCAELGLFELQRDAARGIDMLRSTTPGDDPVFNGSQFLEVVAGPLA